MSPVKATGSRENWLKGLVIKYLLEWAGGKLEIFSKNLVAQRERNKNFLWPFSPVGKFFMAHL